MGTTRRENHVPLCCAGHRRPRIFTGRGERTRRRLKARRSTSRQTESPLNAIPRCQAVKERRKLPLGPPPASPSLLALPPCNSTRWCRNVSRLPCRGVRHPPIAGPVPPVLLTAALACPLGSTDPCRIALHTEPFPTSVFKVPI